MKKLVNLRHLALNSCNNLSHMPPDLNSLTSLRILTMFVAGNETSSQGKIGKLRDLKTLVNLRDDLTVKVNDNFSCDVAEYKEVELLRLTPLKHLTVEFKDEGATNHETLLGCLQPHCRLSTISVDCYRGLKLPLWAESLTKSLPHLVYISLVNFDCLEVLPSLSELHHLKYLELKGISNVEFVENDGVVIPFDNQYIFFPSLEELELNDLPKLKGWWREEAGQLVAGEACLSSLIVPSFPCLRKLDLEDCPNLTGFPSCPKLITVKLLNCHEALALLDSKAVTFCNPTSSFVLHLEKLTIDNVEALDCLFGESLGGIQQLVIRYFEGENLRNLAAEAVMRLNIKKLNIWSCDNLKSLSGFAEHLTGLQSLSIGYCDKLELENNEEGVTVMPLISLNSLSSLKLYSLAKLSNLPEAFQNLTSLEYLEISKCYNLEALPEWLNCLTSLKTLSIKRCNRLISLPEAIAHMPSLKTLDLSFNLYLNRRCSKPNGKDWPKICRIPRVLYA